MSAVNENSEPPPASARYGAPALEKGLDLLEALADEPGGISQKALAARVGRSVGEIFRMLGVLESRGYVAREPRTGQYGLTLKLFALAHRHEPTRRLQAAALPEMQTLAETIGQSCHLCVASERRLMVVAQAEPRGPMVFSVKLGADFALSARYVSVRVLAAFASPAGRDALMRAMAEADGDDPGLPTRLDAIRAAGHALAPSETTGGVTDLAAPVFGYMGEVKASLVVPLLPQIGRTPAREIVVQRLMDTAARISAAIGAPGMAPDAREPLRSPASGAM